MANGDTSQQFTGSLIGINGTADTEDGKTVELEGNMLSLLQAANGANDMEQQSSTNSKMEMSAESVSLMANGDTSQQFTGSLIGINGTADTEDGKTVELEGDMLSLLQATDARESKKEGKMNIDGMNSVTGSSISASLSDDHLIRDFDNRNPLNEKIEPRKDENILIDISEVQTGFASLRQSPYSNNKGEAFRTDSHCKIMETSNLKMRRRKSLSSKSFAIDRTHQSQSLVEDISSEQSSLIVEKSVSFSDTTEFITTLTSGFGSNDHKEKVESVDVALITSMFLGGLTDEETQGDEPSDSFARFGKSDVVTGKIICERWTQFIEAVCGEVERRTDDAVTAASSLASLVEDDPRFFSVIQNRFECSGDDSVMRKSLRNLIQAGQTLIEYEWNSWLATVLESFHGPLNDISQILFNDEPKLDEALQHCKSLHVNISFMNDTKTKRARRKSLLRHQSSVRELQGEIDNLEAQLSSIRSELEEMQIEETEVFKATTDCHNISYNAKLYDDLKSKAECSQKTFLSLRGLHSWSIGTVSDQGLQVSATGSCQHTHLKLMYKGTKFGKACPNVLSKIGATDSIGKSLHIYNGTIASFLEMTTKKLAHKSQQSCAKGPIRIRHHLQKYTWLLGRLDIVAKEFQVVQRRFRGKLYRNGAEGSFSFIVEFESEKSTIVADFTIEPVYPSFPVEVRLDLISGQQDLERVRKALVKNAKPGFGSLSRACDIIQSIVRGKGGMN
mmetsp:Transcript_28868/g.78207  ORF Transcript_28868/g.78207 Transcript_28868/m.78207 type:complete len:732 (-) Transcript_28868:1304-3499(-)